MRVNKKPFGYIQAKATITGEVEVRLPQQLYASLMQAVLNLETTMSWVTRYCVFKLIRSSTFSEVTQYDLTVAEDKEEVANEENFHRHVLCLYGRDEELIKMAASELGWTKSRLVRVALRLYLSELSNDHSADNLKKYGTKIVKKIEIRMTNNGFWPESSVFMYKLFEGSDWW